VEDVIVGMPAIAPRAMDHEILIVSLRDSGAR
jgi:hypothetical protein